MAPRMAWALHETHGALGSHLLAHLLAVGAHRREQSTWLMLGSMSWRHCQWQSSSRALLVGLREEAVNRFGVATIQTVEAAVAALA